MHLVIIEWDGKGAPTAYYHRMDKMGLRSRTKEIVDKGSLEPIARRMNEDGSGGVIMQEGCILTPSESQARAVARLAERYGAKTIFIAPHIQVESYSASERDLWAVSRIDAVYGRRGKPPVGKSLAVCCYEELASYDVIAPDVAQCPGCGGFNIEIHEGETPRFYSGGASNDIWTYWLATRFSTGFFFAPQDSINPQMPHPDMDTQPKIGSDKQQRMVNKIMASPFVETLIDDSGLPDGTILLLLDSIFVSREFVEAETRNHERLMAITGYFGRDGDPAKVSLSEPGNRVDLFDAQHLGADELVELAVNHSELLV